MTQPMLQHGSVSPICGVTFILVDLVVAVLSGNRQPQVRHQLDHRYYVNMRGVQQGCGCSASESSH